MGKALGGVVDGSRGYTPDVGVEVPSGGHRVRRHGGSIVLLNKVVEVGLLTKLAATTNDEEGEGAKDGDTDDRANDGPDDGGGRGG